MNKKKDELVKDVKELFKNITDEERINFVEETLEGYCKYCGSEYLPCYCTNDD